MFPLIHHHSVSLCMAWLGFRGELGAPAIATELHSSFLSLSSLFFLSRARSAPPPASSGVVESHFSLSLSPCSTLDWRLRCSMLLDRSGNVSGGHLGVQECTGSGGLLLCNSFWHWNPWGRAGRSAWWRGGEWLRPLGEFLAALSVGFFSLGSFVSWEESSQCGVRVRKWSRKLHHKSCREAAGLGLANYSREAKWGPSGLAKSLTLSQFESGRWEIGREEGKLWPWLNVALVYRNWTEHLHLVLVIGHTAWVLDILFRSCFWRADELVLCGDEAFELLDLILLEVTRGCVISLLAQV